tara:strand:+ start:938 stop:1435 length:498 start_codon:yes stop_codon:yes gene_type:complete
MAIDRVTSFGATRRLGSLNAATGVVTLDAGGTTTLGAAATRADETAINPGHYVQVSTAGSYGSLPDGLTSLRVNDLVLAARTDSNALIWATLRAEDFMSAIIIGDVRDNAFFQGNPTRISSEVRYPENFQAKLIQLSAEEPIVIETDGLVRISSGTRVKIFSEDA